MVEPTTTQPTLEQCERLALALGFPALAPALRPPYYEESLRNLHGIAQKALNGDDDAIYELEALREVFARDV